MKANIVAVVGIILIAISLPIGFIQVPKEELYWQKIDEYDWTIATKTIKTYPYLNIALLFAVVGGFLNWLRCCYIEKRKERSTDQNPFFWLSQELKDLGNWIDEEIIERELSQINPSVKELRTLLMKKHPTPFLPLAKS